LAWLFARLILHSAKFFIGIVAMETENSLKNSTTTGV